jgi:hypothetical protein
MGDYNGRTYEFVSKTEMKAPKIQIQNIIRELQRKLRSEGVTFDPKLIGSGSKNLVTRVKGGNLGFDFDYNFVIQKDQDMGAKELRLLFVRALNDIVRNTHYSNVSDGKNSISIKVVDKRKSRIVHSCDFAIINEYTDNSGNLNQEILIHERNRRQYIWTRKPSRKNYNQKLANLKANGLWNELRQEYLKLKSNNMDSGKKSFALFYESINNVYGRYNWY